MKPVLDDVLLPCHWVHKGTRDDGMEFRRDDDRFAITALQSGECPPRFGPYSDRCWGIRLHQRAGEARSSTPLEYVTTRRLALDTALMYMGRINETIEREGATAPGTMSEPLAGKTTSENGDWERPSSERIDVGSPTL